MTPRTGAQAVSISPPWRGGRPTEGRRTGWVIPVGHTPPLYDILRKAISRGEGLALHLRLALKHQAQCTKGASPPGNGSGEPGLPGLVD